jgi:hypothetical protein
MRARAGHDRPPVVLLIAPIRLRPHGSMPRLVVGEGMTDTRARVCRDQRILVLEPTPASPLPHAEIPPLV